MIRVLTLLTFLLSPLSAAAEQKVTFDGFEAHYIVLSTMALKPEIAQHYNLTRAPDRALINISVLDPDGTPTPARVTGSVKNLLAQTSELTFREVREDYALYYLATIRYSDQDVLRFTFAVETDGRSYTFEHQQRMYLEPAGSP